MEILVPVADTYGDMIIGSPNHTISLGEKSIMIRYNYEYEKLLDADNPELGKVGERLKVLEEYTIARNAIKAVCITRDEQARVFIVGIDSATIWAMDLQINFKALIYARKFRDKITAWWLAPCKDI